MEPLSAGLISKATAATCSLHVDSDMIDLALSSDEDIGKKLITLTSDPQKECPKEAKTSPTIFEENPSNKVDEVNGKKIITLNNLRIKYFITIIKEYKEI